MPDPFRIEERVRHPRAPFSELRRAPGKTADATPVLLLHGASARHENFLIPPPALDGEPRALAVWLWQRGYEPWLLDWRGSSLIQDQLAANGDRDAPHEMRFDLAANQDVAEAVRIIRKERPDATSLGAVGHCMGGASLAEFVARREPGLDLGITHLVLLSMGLFYETPLASNLKNQDPVLDRLAARRLPPPGAPRAAAAPNEVRRIDPRDSGSWPDEIEEIYRNWPHQLRPHAHEEHTRIGDLCNRLSFMYGTIYREAALAPEIHHATARLAFDRGARAFHPGATVQGTESGARGRVLRVRREQGTWSEGDAAGRLVLIQRTGRFREDEALLTDGRRAARCRRAVHARAELPHQFGGIPLKMFAHGAQNARRGWAGAYGADHWDKSLIGSASLASFSRLTRITLITGAHNQLWHRDSIDRMYEWLRRGGQWARERVKKHVLAEYGHQDLLWGETAATDVFHRIEHGLGEPRMP